MISIMIDYLVAFYLAHFDDFFTTVLTLKAINFSYEANPVMRLAKNPALFALFKFGLATLIVLLTCIYSPLHFFLYVDTLFEIVVTFNNINSLRTGKLISKKR